MKWPFWFKLGLRRKPPPITSLTQCPTCGREMILVERTSFSGDDMRSYRCEHCQKEHIVNFGPALWKVLSDARRSDDDAS